MKKWILQISILIAGFPLLAGNIYISVDGNDNNSGSSPDESLATIKEAFQLAQAGDTILMLPGVYTGTTYINGKHGAPDRPIVLKSIAEDPLEFAVVDAQATPSNNSPSAGIYLIGCSWIELEGIVFRNCWTDVIAVQESNYITVRSCHFTSGKRPVIPVGHDSHHVLVEHCYVKHPDAVWQGWSWEEIHHGAFEHYNGALLHPRKSAGGHVMRHNTLINLFNGFRTRPAEIREDGNTEIYGNEFINIRDNEFEPEGWAWNMHYYHNRHLNIHKSYSIDHVEGGQIFIYGNTFTQTKDEWALEEVSGIFKYKGGPLTYPCYAFNNSYYTEAKVLRKGESTNHLLKHFNNAYYFFSGSNNFQLTEWQPGFAFDHDIINREFPANIRNNEQETNGLPLTDIQFVDGENGDFRLQAGSPGIDAGKPLEIPLYNWKQRYKGDAPDIGAYEGDQLADGPPFRFIPSPEGAYYEERPRISRHRIDSNTLVLYFSAPLDPASVNQQAIVVFDEGLSIPVDSVWFPNHQYELYVQTADPLNAQNVSILFDQQPVGLNALPATYWASTIAIGNRVKSAPDLSHIPEETPTPTENIPEFQDATLAIIPNPATGTCKAIVKAPKGISSHFAHLINIYDLQGNLVFSDYKTYVEGNEVVYELENLDLPSGMYIAHVGLAKRILTTKLVIL